jgi:HEAT repeat protein
MLRDEDLYVKVAALKALGQIGSESVIPVLKEAAASSNVLIRQAARDALKAAERVEHGDEKS